MATEISELTSAKSAGFHVVSYEGGLRWIAFGDNVPAFQRLFATRTDSLESFTLINRTEEQELSEVGALMLAEEQMRFAIESGRVKLYGSQTIALPSDVIARRTIKEISPHILKSGWVTYDDEWLVFIGDTTFDNLCVDFVELMRAFPFRTSVWRKQLDPNAFPEGEVPDRDETLSGSAETQESAVEDKLTAAAEVQCGRWLKEKFVSTPLPIPKASLREEALAVHPGLSKRAFARAWERHVPSSWKKPGPR